MKFSILRLLALAFVASAFLAASQCVLAQCSNATLRGHYAFTITGQILAPPPAAGLITGVAMTEFDGKGNFTQVDHAVHNGVPPQEDWRPGSGPYHVNPDCTGTMTITQHPTIPADASREIGIGTVIGVMTLIVVSSRAPRSTSAWCSIMAHSYGAAGHLKNGPSTLTMASPRSKLGMTSRSRSAPSTV